MKDNNTSQIKIYLTNFFLIWWVEAEAEIFLTKMCFNQLVS